MKQSLYLTDLKCIEQDYEEDTHIAYVQTMLEII